MSELADKIIVLEGKLQELEAYCEYLERAQDAIHDAQSQHSVVDAYQGSLPYPCASEVEECFHAAEEERDRIADLLAEVDDIEC